MGGCVATGCTARLGWQIVRRGHTFHRLGRRDAPNGASSPCASAAGGDHTALATSCTCPSRRYRRSSPAATCRCVNGQSELGMAANTVAWPHRFEHRASRPKAEIGPLSACEPGRPGPYRCEDTRPDAGRWRVAHPRRRERRHRGRILVPSEHLLRVLRYHGETSPQRQRILLPIKNVQRCSG